MLSRSNPAPRFRCVARTTHRSASSRRPSATVSRTEARHLFRRRVLAPRRSVGVVGYAVLGPSAAGSATTRRGHARITRLDDVAARNGVSGQPDREGWSWSGGDPLVLLRACRGDPGERRWARRGREPPRGNLSPDFELPAVTAIGSRAGIAVGGSETAWRPSIPGRVPTPWPEAAA